MNKLTGMSKLAGAYHYLTGIDRLVNFGGEMDTPQIVFDKFHQLRRSLTIEDLKPTPKCVEGFNGRMPTQL